MNEINRTNLSEQTKYRLSEITGIEHYFHQEINQIKLCTKILSKYVTAFDYIDKILIVLSVTTGGVSIISLQTLWEHQLEQQVHSNSIFTLIFSSVTAIIKKLLSITRNKKKKHNKILILAKSKLNDIETLVSQALIDMEIIHEELVTILNERDKYKK